MNHSVPTRNAKLSAGLYFVATPIGNARDITLRALDVLASADVIAAEDTRNTRRLMEIHGIAIGTRKLISYHDHNGPRARPGLIAAMKDGQSVAYASDAGTPLVADPGYGLMTGAIEEELSVWAVPGASAPLAALSIAGLPTDRFLFAGFAPNAKSARMSFFEELDKAGSTIVLFESPKRVKAFLRDASVVFGLERRAAICRELTKKFEEVLRGSLKELSATLDDRTLKGELVIVIEKAGDKELSQDLLDAEIKKALPEMSVRDLVALISSTHGVPKKQVYQRALELSGKSNADENSE
ncbi:MAG: 16S rRNA (cytidine(1402)-2'-O)-methyltransferase [Pseudomonadota bacterium]